AMGSAIPAGGLGGVRVGRYGSIGITGIKNRRGTGVGFRSPVTQFTAAIALIIGIADVTLAQGEVSFGGIALGTVAALVVFHLMNAIARVRGTGAQGRPRIPVTAPADPAWAEPTDDPDDGAEPAGLR